MLRQLFCIKFVLFFLLKAPAQNYVILYEDCKYKGRVAYLEPGAYRDYQMKIKNDALSSIQVPPGMKITLYEHNNFQGRSVSFTSHVYCLDQDWNDVASSIVIESSYTPPSNTNSSVTFYYDCYSKGYSLSLTPGTYTGNQLGNLWRNISSFTINGYLRVKVFTTSDNATGYHETFESSQLCLNSAFNDKIRSVVIENRRWGGNNSGWGNNNQDNYATVYADCNYRGNSLSLVPGYYQGDKLGILKYDISSIKLPANLRARVYINNEYLSGSNYILNENSNCLSSTINNKIGSLIIEDKRYGNNNNNNNYNPYDDGQRVIIYVHENYQGQSVSLLPGMYSRMNEIGFPDNALSSLTVPAGYRVVLYEHSNFGGKTYTITNSKSKFYISGWNDKTSSIAVYRDR